MIEWLEEFYSGDLRDSLLASLGPLFARYAAERGREEGFGDFLLRAGVVDIPEKDRRRGIALQHTLVEDAA